LRQHLTPRLSASVILWRIEAAVATPLALLLVATIGRWTAALAMGAVMAVFAAIFLAMLNEQTVLVAFREWARDHRLISRMYRPLVHPQSLLAILSLILLLPVLVLLLGPFWRAVAFHSLALRRDVAYGISVLGSIPHSLLWTGLILGGLWEGIVWPIIKAIF
jgi:hypothetical protein